MSFISWFFFPKNSFLHIILYAISLQTLFTLLVQYFCDLAVQDPPVLGLMDRLTGPLYDLTQMSKVIAGQTMLEVIKEKQEEFTQYSRRKGGRGAFPALDVVRRQFLFS